MIDTSMLDPIAIFLLDATIKTSLFMGIVLFAVWILGTRQAAKAQFAFELVSCRRAGHSYRVICACLHCDFNLTRHRHSSEPAGT